MQNFYENTAQVLKILGDPKRLQIIDMLSCGKVCVCKILKGFDITQPTLSHDMKQLINAGIITAKKDGKNIYYSLNRANLQNLLLVLRVIFE